MNSRGDVTMAITKNSRIDKRICRLVGEDIYEAGFDAVRRHFGQAAPTRAQSRSRAVPHAATGDVITAGAVIATRHGGPEVLEWREVEVPPPGPGEVRLHHTAIGVNYIDVYCRTGYFRDLLSPLADVAPDIEMRNLVKWALSEEFRQRLQRRFVPLPGALTARTLRPGEILAGKDGEGGGGRLLVFVQLEVGTELDR